MNIINFLPALKHSNFRLFWAGQLISLTGTWMHQMAQGWLVYRMTDSPFYLGLAGTAASAPILLFTLAGGVLADRHPRRKILISAHLILLLLTLTLTLLTYYEQLTVWHILILGFLIGTVHAFEIPARQAFLIDMVGPDNLLNAIALNSTAFHAARMIGPAIAGLLIVQFGPALCFFINTLSFSAFIFALATMRLPHKAVSSAEKIGIKQSLRQGISYIYHNKEVYPLLLLVGTMSFFGFPYISFLPVYAQDILQTGPTGLGTLMGFAGAGAFTGAVLLSFRGGSTRKGLIMAGAGITFSIALIIFSISKLTWLSYTMLFFIGFGAINQIATVNSIIQLSVPDEMRGRVMSAFTTMFLGMAPLGNFTLGSLAHFTGTRTALTTGAILCLSGTILLLLKKRGILRM
ncbi:MAG: MFS transporter [Nitrospira sp.]|nr:MFS transporter [Nitrospira sp.]